jgi:hypothetical protein
VRLLISSKGYCVRDTKSEKLLLITAAKILYSKLLANYPAILRADTLLNDLAKINKNCISQNGNISDTSRQKEWPVMWSALSEAQQ